jgi:activating signal cointegrator 1
MRALSLWQPWATLIALGEKKIETRHWHTDYRGPVAIHAAKSSHVPRKMLVSVGRSFNDEIIRNTLAAHSIEHLKQLPFGAILCIVRILWTRPTDHIVIDPEMKDQLTTRELAFGNYEPGRYAWGLELVKVYSRPIPARGHQSFWQWEANQAELHAEVRS